MELGYTAIQNLLVNLVWQNYTFQFYGEKEFVCKAMGKSPLNRLVPRVMMEDHCEFTANWHLLSFCAWSGLDLILEVNTLYGVFRLHSPITPVEMEGMHTIYDYDNFH